MVPNRRIVATKPPLAEDADGVIRVAGTRVRLETVLVAFQQGHTPEAIAYKYPSLSLADIYFVIAHYLQQREQFDDYLAERGRLANEADKEIEDRFPSNGIRERLLARRNAKK